MNIMRAHTHTHYKVEVSARIRVSVKVFILDRMRRLNGRGQAVKQVTAFRWLRMRRSE